MAKKLLTPGNVFTVAVVVISIVFALRADRQLATITRRITELEETAGRSLADLIERIHEWEMGLGL